MRIIIALAGRQRSHCRKARPKMSRLQASLRRRESGTRSLGGDIRCPACERLGCPAEFSTFCGAECFKRALTCSARSHAMVHAHLARQQRRAPASPDDSSRTPTGLAKTAEAPGAAVFEVVGGQGICGLGWRATRDIGVAERIYAGPCDLQSRVWRRTPDLDGAREAAAIDGRYNELALQLLASRHRFPSSTGGHGLGLPFAARHLRRRRSMFPHWDDETWSEARAFVETHAAGFGEPDIFLHGLPLYALNHSCWPNAVLSYTEAAGGTWEVVAIEPIGRGHEITCSYVNLPMPTAQRREHIRWAWGFECQCRRCMATPPMPADLRLAAQRQKPSNQRLPGESSQLQDPSAGSNQRSPGASMTDDGGGAAPLSMSNSTKPPSSRAMSLRACLPATQSSRPGDGGSVKTTDADSEMTSTQSSRPGDDAPHGGSAKTTDADSVMTSTRSSRPGDDAPHGGSAKTPDAGLAKTQHQPDAGSAMTSDEMRHRLFEVLLRMSDAPSSAWMAKVSSFADEHGLEPSHWQVHELRWERLNYMAFGSSLPRCRDPAARPRRGTRGRKSAHPAHAPSHERSRVWHVYIGGPPMRPRPAQSAAGTRPHRSLLHPHDAIAPTLPPRSPLSFLTPHLQIQFGENVVIRTEERRTIDNWGLHASPTHTHTHKTFEKMFEMMGRRDGH